MLFYEAILKFVHFNKDCVKRLKIIFSKTRNCSHYIVEVVVMHAPTTRQEVRVMG